MRRSNKRFLTTNPSESGAIIWYVRKEEDSRFEVMDASVVIKDCHETVNLDFSVEDWNKLQKRIDKLDVLIEELQKMREAMVVIGTRSTKFTY